MLGFLICINSSLISVSPSYGEKRDLCRAFLRRVSFNLPFIIPWQFLLNPCAFSLSLAPGLEDCQISRFEEEAVATSEKGQNTVPPMKKTGTVFDKCSFLLCIQCLLWILPPSFGEKDWFSTTSILCCSHTQRPDCQEPEQTALVFSVVCYEEDLPLVTLLKSCCNVWWGLKWGVRLGVSHCLASRTTTVRGYH